MRLEDISGPGGDRGLQTGTVPVRTRARTCLLPVLVPPRVAPGRASSVPPRRRSPTQHRDTQKVTVPTKTRARRSQNAGEVPSFPAAKTAPKEFPVTRHSAAIRTEPGRAAHRLIVAARPRTPIPA